MFPSSTYGSAPISDTGLSVPSGIPMRIFNLADSTGLTVPSSAWAIPAASQPEKGNGHDRPAPIGHNSGESAPMADEDGGTKARAIAEIQAGLLSRLGPTFEYMTAEEIGAAKNRGVLLKRAQADGMAYLSRAIDALPADPEGKRHGTTLVPYVFSYECLFSDNPDGCSTVTNNRLAALLGVTERAIRYARKLLVELRKPPFAEPPQGSGMPTIQSSAGSLPAPAFR